MIVGIALLTGGFLALWGLPLLWLAAGRGGSGWADTAAWNRATIALGAYAALFLAAAWWWHTPLSVQKSLSNLASSPRLAALPVDCTDLRAATDRVQSLSGGKFAISAEGSVLVAGELWNALQPAQRESLASLARQIAACGTGGTGAVVRDAESGAVLVTE